MKGAINMKSGIKIAGLILLALFLSSCGKNYSDYQKILEQRVGDYNVSIYASPDGIKKGSGDLLIEFNKTATGELVKVNNLQVSAVMQMAGSPMSGDISASETRSEGIYKLDYNFSMIGSYNLDITFENGLQARFILTVS
jgi:hypothetical protein